MASRRRISQLGSFIVLAGICRHRGRCCRGGSGAPVYLDHVPAGGKTRKRPDLAADPGGEGHAAQPPGHDGRAVQHPVRPVEPVPARGLLGPADDDVPDLHRDGRHVGHEAGPRRGDGHLRRGPGDLQPLAPAAGHQGPAQGSDLPRPGDQHRPQSLLGPQRGSLRRRPLPDRPHGASPT